MESWHVPEDDLTGYAEGSLAAPRLWSTETHLAGCAHCRERLNTAVGTAAVDAGWARLDAELDAPRPGPVESLLVRLGVADHTARLLAATPVLRRAWLGAVVLTLLVAVAAGHAMRGGSALMMLLATAPLLPLAGVAVSFGPGLDPTYEMAVVAPMHTFRLLMLRTVAVLTTTTTLSALASLALPSFGLAALGWLLPALALTALGLALMPRLGPVVAPSVVAVAWLTAVSLGGLWTGPTAAPFTTAGQCALAAIAVAATAAVLIARDRFDSSRHMNARVRISAGRL
ncbi:hypothetical protein GCM10012280_24600 [Wenjunlia tyrosinilytica]|uniref:Zf-HC2 domain-containing protein n=2 Tax=Wenjunlia tyrosinilytica TaxID=1544741 RepID=A0A917ZPD4_9ACTN|nr:hypothetical protein GCM10012280_24600 [Wenjunlia tyrosinilytica]